MEARAFVTIRTRFTSSLAAANSFDNDVPLNAVSLYPYIIYQGPSIMHHISSYLEIRCLY